MFGQAFQQSGFRRQRRTIVRGLLLAAAATALIAAPTPSASASNQPPNQPSPKPNPGGGTSPICPAICVSNLKVTKKIFPTGNYGVIYFEANTHIPTHFHMQVALADNRDPAGNLKNPVVEYKPDYAPSTFHVGSAGVDPGKRYYWALKFYVDGKTVFERGYVDVPVIVQGAGNPQVKP